MQLLAIAAVALSLTSANSTAYTGGGTTYCGTPTGPRVVAVLPGTLPCGTKIRIVGKQAGPGGLRKWIVRDHIGCCSELDFWVPGDPDAWGRRDVKYKRGWGKPRR